MKANTTISIDVNVMREFRQFVDLGNFSHWVQKKMQEEIQKVKEVEE